MISRLRHVAPKHRRVLIISASVVGVLLVTGYVMWSMSTWGMYKTSYETWQKELHASVDKAVALPAASLAERLRKMTALKDVSGKITTAKQSLCAVPGLVAWQHSFSSSLREDEGVCSRVVEKSNAFKEKLEDVIRYLESDQALAAIIAKAAASSKGKTTEKTWNSQISTWRTTTAAIKEMSSDSPAFTSVKKSALERTQLIEKSWEGVIATHKAKDKTKYMAAQTNLTQAYEKLPEITARSTKQFAGLTASLQTAYVQAFDMKA